MCLEAHENIIRILPGKSLHGDLEQMTEQVNTTMLEVFHAVKIGFLPKSRCFNIGKNDHRLPRWTIIKMLTENK